MLTHAQKFYTDPLRLDSVTTCIHSLLKDTVAPKASVVNFKQSDRGLSKIERLPVELLSRISTNFFPISALALHRTSRMLATKVPMDNHFWRTTIMNGTALPYLWDLDSEVLEMHLERHLAASTDPDAMWNWKSVGQLLAKKVFPLKSPDHRLVDLPNGIWNRRRIWSIIEEAYTDDFGGSARKGWNNFPYEERKRCEPVRDWQLEDIMDDLGHYS